MSTTNYGVELTKTSGAVEMQRIGNMALHHVDELPCHQFRAAVVNDDGTVNYWLHPSSHLLKEDGVTPSVLDGSDGQVMVRIPAHWVRFDTWGRKLRVQVSAKELLGYYYQREVWISAFEASLLRSGNKLSSVINTTAGYRGGDNNAAWDGDDRSLLGKPATLISLTNFINYAANRGVIWKPYMYEAHYVMWYLYLIEYANRNSQLAFNATPTGEGFRQGGLGPGVTTVESGQWYAFNSYYPFVPCGVTAGLGVNTGVVNHTVNNWNGGNPLTVEVNSYRGIEMPFGHLWKWTAGILYDIQSNAEGGQSVIYMFKDGTLGTVINGTYEPVGILPRADGYITDLHWGQHGMLQPKANVGGSATTFWADYFYTSIPASGRATRGLLSGGYAIYGAVAGFGCVNSYNAPSATLAYIGSRLCLFSD